MSSLLEQLTSALSARYAVERLIGTGGMATVYLARDLRHDRQVALKVLNPELGAVLGVERFLAEIKVTAGLQHPNLLPLFDSGEAGGLLFYVMPFVEGESLRARLERERQLPVDESIRLAGAIAGALDYAHRHGVVHRDLKPENVLLHEGQPLVADFGIALAVSAAGGARMTLTGLSLGTPQYMAPEQAMGERNIDGRADVFALGAVLYEMLAGEPPFTGPTSQAILAKVITERAPAVTAARSSVPAHVAAAIDMALEKVPADRFQSAADFAGALTHPSVMAARSAAGRASGAQASWIRDPRSWTALGLAAAALVALAAFTRGARAATDPPPVSAQLVFPPAEAPSVGRGIAVSPDGSRLAYVTPTALDGARLWIKSLRDGTAHPLIGTTGVMEPFWSPDGTTIGFFSGGHLLTIPAAGGTTTILAPAPIPEGGTWGANGVIVYNPYFRRLLRISAAGGTPTTALPGEVSDARQRRPTFLPDGRRFLFWDWKAGIVTAWMGDLATGSALPLRDSVYEPAYSARGVLVFTREGQPLLAQPFDVDHRRLTGAPVVLSPAINRDGNWGVFAFSDNVLVYLNADTSRTGAAGGRLWWSRADKRYSPIDTKDPVWTYRVSHDGRRVAMGGFGLWVYDIARGVSVRVPTRLTVAQAPVWSPGDSALAYYDDNAFRIISLTAAGAQEQAISFAPAAEFWGTADWSPDGRSILFIGRSDSLSSNQLWAYSTAEHRSARVLATGGNVFGARFAPDGRWIAYESDESGSNEVYLTRYPESGTPTRVSVAGGGSPRWRADGRELYFVARDGRIMVAAITLGAAQPVATPTVLVSDPVTPEPFGPLVSRFEPMPAGDRFIVSVQTFTPPVLQIITGWSGLIARPQARP